MPKIDLDEELYQKLKERSGKEGFESASDYASHLLDEMLEEMGNSSTTDEEGQSEEEKVKSRLRQLGYLE